MAFPRPWAAASGAAAIMILLAACAPPGQAGDPGVAATFESTAVTNQHLADVESAWRTDTQEKDAPNRRQALTIELLRPALLEKSKELGYPISRAIAEAYAKQWLVYTGSEGEPSDEVVTATQGILALYTVTYSDPSLASLREVSDSVAAGVVVSPRSGVYSTDVLLSSVGAAMQTAESQQLGQFGFTEFQNVTAFADDDRSWFAR